MSGDHGCRRSSRTASRLTDEKTYRKDSSRGEQLTCRVAARKKRGGKVDGGEGVGVKVIPFDEVARRCAYDCDNAPAAICGGGHPPGYGDGIGNRGHASPPYFVSSLFLFGRPGLSALHCAARVSPAEPRI